MDAYPRTVRVVILGVCALCAALPACSSDAAPEPEPTIDEPGAFVAVDEGGGSLVLHRTLDQLKVQNETVIFLTVYDVTPATWEEAREISKQHEIPIRFEQLSAVRSKWPGGPAQVVWFRTLTEEEEDRVQ
jgi:hypothetical protein